MTEPQTPTEGVIRIDQAPVSGRPTEIRLPEADPVRPGPALDSDDPRERLRAFEEVYRRGGPELTRAVRSMLLDPEAEIRRRAIVPAVSTGTLPRTEAVRVLASVLSCDPDASVRSAAATGLASVLAREER